MPPSYLYYSLTLYIRSNFKFCSFHLIWTISTSLKVLRILRANYPITSKISSVHFIKSRTLSKTIQCNHPSQEINTDKTIVQYTDLIQILPIALTIFLFCFGKKWSSPRIHITLNNCISLLSLTRWTRVWVNPGSWWWTGRPGVLQFMGSQSRTRLSDWTEMNWTELIVLQSGTISLAFPIHDPEF